MRRDFIHQHFQKSGFDEMQADALAAVFEEMATKHDLELLRSELTASLNALRLELTASQDALRAELRAGHDALRAELRAGHDALRAELRAGQNALRAELIAGQDAFGSEINASLSAIRTEMATMKADLTWRFIALTVFLSTVVGLIGVFAA
ncbi:MAG: hypothetical protein WD423_02315 [Rhodothermales bacterium]